MLTIAVCDDDPAFAYTLTQKLRELCAHYVPDHIDCQILPEFTSATEVLRYLSKYSIDILFLDIVMPQTNGFQLAGVLMERYPNTLILFVSAHDDFVYKSFAFNPFRFLRKEHLAKELPYALQKAVEKFQALCDGSCGTGGIFQRGLLRKNIPTPLRHDSGRVPETVKNAVKEKRQPLQTAEKCVY